MSELEFSPHAKYHIKNKFQHPIDISLSQRHHKDVFCILCIVCKKGKPEEQTCVIEQLFIWLEKAHQPSGRTLRPVLTIITSEGGKNG